MKNTKYLNLKSKDDPLYLHHSSCLVDEYFKIKFTKNYNKELLARKEEENAILSSITQMSDEEEDITVKHEK